MTKNIVIAGSGFAGLWAAVSAARAISIAQNEVDVHVTIVSPAPNLVIRPRLYEAVLDDVNVDIGRLLDAIDVRHIAGLIETIDTSAHQVTIAHCDGSRMTMGYDKFILATGSHLFEPPIPGLAEHAFNVDQYAEALRLGTHLETLASRQASEARNTVVIAGGGFTGIETAAEMPDRLRAVFGGDVQNRVLIVEKAPCIGPDLGANPRPVIEEALAECGVEIVPGVAVAAIDPDGIMLSSGERIPTNTVIWTGGARASSLTAQLTGEKDHLGRVHSDAFLRAADADVFVTGDVVHAVTDDAGNVAMMSCQHATSLGRVAGHNAAAELVGLPLHPYSQPRYVTCLDIGPWGAIFAEGWERTVHLRGEEGKKIKREINTKWIYPPDDRNAAFAIAHPDFVIVP